jgi:hypothetical protein
VFWRYNKLAIRWEGVEISQIRRDHSCWARSCRTGTLSLDKSRQEEERKSCRLASRVAFYVFQNWFSCSSIAGLDHVQEPCSAMDCWNAEWINWVGKVGVSSEVGDSIWLFLQVFDCRVGVVCCTFICYLCCTGVRTCIEAVTLCRASTDRKDVWSRQNMEESYFIIVIRSFGELSKCRRQIGGKSLRQRRNNPYLLHEDSTELQANGKKGALVRLQQTWQIRHKLDE